jgi:tripartite-type tricarboxylate transporter receptor subunit TctC
MLSRRELGLGALACASFGLPDRAAAADPSDGFFKGKNIYLAIGYPPGGANDAYARLLGQFLGKYIPGNPTLVPENMPGAGSFVAVNNVYNAAPRDGTTIGVGAPTIALDEKLGTSGVHFKTAELNWIGRVNPLINIVMTWKTCPVKTIAEAQKTQVTLSGTGAGSTVSIYPTVLNNVIGTKFKLIMGYSGTREAMLAMERGEVEGHSTAWDALETAHPDWVSNKDVNILVQFSLHRDPHLADVPTAVELGRTDDDKKVLAAIMAASDIGEAFFTTPDTPKNRVETLRQAFDQAMKDPGLLAEAKKMQLGISPLGGAGVQKLIESVTSLSPALLARVKAVYPTTG